MSHRSPALPAQSAEPVATLAPQMPIAAAGRSTGPGLRWRSSELLGAAQEVEIEHGEATYRLRLTQQGKLILTK